MRLFDTHAHLLDKRFDDDRQTLIQEMPGLGMVGMIECGTDLADSKNAAVLAADTLYIYAAVGIHPSEAEDVPTNYLEQIELLTRQSKVVAIGEIGLDYHYDFSPRDAQRRVFEQQLCLAEKLNMPVALHMRESTQDMMGILREHNGIRGVVHCFSGSAQTAEQCVAMGLCVSFTGTVTFKNAKKTMDAATVVPLSSIMAETDSPYLSPEPKRGGRNNPVNVQFVLQKLAEIKGVSFEEMCEINIENAKGLYNI